MTLADLLAAMPTGLSGLALVFPQELRDRLVAVQAEHGNPRFTAYPALLTDGRYMHQAGILTECQPGGLYYGGFSQLDAGRFSEIAVVPLAEALALLPTDSP
jgi:hypothetical protein